jgi:hypothetical protein
MTTIKVVARVQFEHVRNPVHYSGSAIGHLMNKPGIAAITVAVCL